MPAILPFVPLITAGAGLASTIIGARAASRSKPAVQQPAPPVPTQEDATTKAQEEIKKRRRISLLSGGNTNITRGKALVQEGDVETKTLLGQ